MRFVLNSAIAIGALTLTACGSEPSATFTTEDGETVEVTAGEDSSGETSMRITGPDGEEIVSRTGADVEPALPDGIKMYPGAKIISNTVISGGSEGSGSMIMFESSDSPEEITTYYREQIKQAGIEIQIDAKMNEAHMIAGEKASDNSSFMVTATRDEGEDEVTSAQMMVSMKPKE